MLLYFVIFRGCNYGLTYTGPEECTFKSKYYKEVFVKHEKAPTAPRFEGVLNISYMIMFGKTLSSILAKFCHFSGGRNCQKAHLHIKIFDLNLRRIQGDQSPDSLKIPDFFPNFSLIFPWPKMLLYDKQ